MANNAKTELFKEIKALHDKVAKYDDEKANEITELRDRTYRLAYTCRRLRKEIRTLGGDALCDMKNKVLS